MLHKTPLVLLAIALLALGCGKNKVDPDPEGTHRKAELGEIHEMYTMHNKNHQRPPRQLSDLKQYQTICPMGFRGLQDGKYVAVWGVSSKDARTVLAYQKDAPRQGGAVLMADGTIKNLSADELQGALKSRN
jgi:hypothetical protein